MCGVAGSRYQRSNPFTYDTIGRGYAGRRVPDPRIAAAIWHALGDARRICNVGAGAGSYEPTDREVVAVEPSRAMIAQRANRRVVRARAEALPFADATFDAVTALMTVHHWQDLAAGIAELRRVAPLRVVFTFDPTRGDDLWLVRDYLPEIQELEHARAPRIDTLVELLGGAEVSVVPVPWDCSDGFQAAYWRRPERYLDPEVRASISTLAMLPEAVVERAMTRLAVDLGSGAWAARNAELLSRDEMDYAYRLLVSRERC
jgi:SAM-dependent methyltransferase